MTADNLILQRERTLADYKKLGQFNGILEFLSWQSKAPDHTLALYARYAIDAYHQILMNEANEDIDPEVPTEAEVDEMARVHEATRKSGRAPHEL